MHHKFEDSMRRRFVHVEFNFAQSRVHENRSGEVFPQYYTIGFGGNFPVKFPAVSFHHHGPRITMMSVELPTFCCHLFTLGSDNVYYGF